MCPNKLHKDFSNREREREVENECGVGGSEKEQFSHWNAHL